MTTEIQITGTLHHARRVNKGEDPRAPCLCGYISDDVRGRFNNGDFVVTSTIMHEDGNIFQTRNSIYKVESWAVDERAYDINSLVDYFHNKSCRNGWWPDSMRNNSLVVSNKLALIHSEISEAMEGDRKNAMDDKLPHRKMIEVELADALIRICDLAGFLGLDLGGAVVEKDAFNDVRKDHKMEARNAPGGKAY